MRRTIWARKNWEFRIGKRLIFAGFICGTKSGFGSMAGGAWRINLESIDFAKIVWLFQPFISPVHR